MSHPCSLIYLLLSSLLHLLSPPHLCLLSPRCCILASLLVSFLLLLWVYSSPWSAFSLFPLSCAFFFFFFVPLCPCAPILHTCSLPSVLAPSPVSSLALIFLSLHPHFNFLFLILSCNCFLSCCSFPCNSIDSCMFFSICCIPAWLILLVHCILMYHPFLPVSSHPFYIFVFCVLVSYLYPPISNTKYYSHTVDLLFICVLLMDL